MINITKEKFEKYVNVQHSGITNMFNVEKVCALSGLTRDEVMEIMSNYGKYEHGNFAVETKEIKKDVKTTSAAHTEDVEETDKKTNIKE